MQCTGGSSATGADIAAVAALAEACAAPTRSGEPDADGVEAAVTWSAGSIAPSVARVAASLSANARPGCCEERAEWKLESALVGSSAIDVNWPPDEEAETGGTACATGSSSSGCSCELARWCVDAI